MKVYISTIVGQQIDGQNVIVKIEKASVDKSKIDAMASLKNPWTEETDTPSGKANMLFQRNVQEIEVEDVPASK